MSSDIGEVDVGQATTVVSRWYFPLTSILIAVVVAYGFSFTVGDNLIRPQYPRPWILYVHAVIMSAWILLLIVQVMLVRYRNVNLHRQLGRWGLALGALIPVVGIATAVAMARVRLQHGDTDGAVSFPIPINDVLAFTVAFWLAAYWRKRRPDYHRRLMYVATCALTAAAFGRMPALDHAEWFYVGVDALVLLGAMADLATLGTVHRVYRFALPALMVAQLLTAYVRWTPAWLSLAPRLFG
jgi:hypothetical protein